MTTKVQTLHSVQDWVSAYDVKAAFCGLARHIRGSEARETPKAPIPSMWILHLLNVKYYFVAQFFFSHVAPSSSLQTKGSNDANNARVLTGTDSLDTTHLTTLQSVDNNASTQGWQLSTSIPLGVNMEARYIHDQGRGKKILKLYTDWQAHKLGGLLNATNTIPQRNNFCK